MKDRQEMYQALSEYNRNGIHAISGSFGVDSNCVTHPHITSKGNVGLDIANAITILKMVANPEVFLK